MHDPRSALATPAIFRATLRAALAAFDGRRRTPAAALSRADRERLRAACRRAEVDPRRSIYGPDSVTWRVNREAVLLLGGGRALLLQVAHPLIAAGVAAHSDFQSAPLRRLWRTLDLTLTMTFAGAAEAVAALHAIERVHARVRGVLPAPAGPFPGGTPYAAGDPELLYWVYATLVDTALLVYERFVAPLPAAQRARYYDESKTGARLFGVPERLIPRDLAAFRAYVRAMVRGDVLTVGATGRALAAAILRPPLAPGLQHAVRATNLFTVGLLPAAVRARYGLPWGPLRAAALQTAAAASRRMLPLLPATLRWLPHARRAGAEKLGC